MKIVLNAVIARKNGGGATQIVLNYLMASLSDEEVDWFYIVSEELYESLKGSVEISSSNWLVLPRQPQLKTYCYSQKKINAFLESIQPDIVYSILAPSYFRFKYTEVMRCCNAWDVIERNNLAFSFIDWKTKLKFRTKTLLVRILMRRADFFITQTEVAKDGIIRVTGKSYDKVAVIPNVLPRFYQSIIPEQRPSDTIDILYVASPAPHKNLEIIPEVASILKYKYGLEKFRFLITIPSEDFGITSLLLMRSKQLRVENEVVNIGSKTQKELVELYETASVGFFPSVLETFSATLLEYMYFKLPIISSNQRFNTEVLRDAALFFDATDAKEAAKLIYEVVSNQTLSDSLRKKAELRIVKYLDYNEHYSSTIDFFRQIINKQK